MGCPVEGEDNVVGRERRAVMEFDGRPQLESPCRRVDIGPFCGQPGFELHLAVTADQRLVHAHIEEQQKGLLAGVRIHRVGVAVIRPAKSLRLSRCGERNDHRQRR